MDMNDINGSVRELVADHKEHEAYDILQAKLMEYYSTPEGKEELANSPQKNLKTAEAVSLLMQGVPKRIQREVKLRDA